eukprot:766801-Hanusia_phi.AAC.4
MMWTLDAPYKIWSALLVLTCLVTAVAACVESAPNSYYWFAMGSVIYAYTYAFILSIVRQRLEFFTSCARDNNAKNSITRGAGLISDDFNHVCLCILDVLAKPCYGFALLYFKMYFDKKLIESGVDEEDFAKYSKVTSMHVSEDQHHKKHTLEEDEIDDIFGGGSSPLQSKIRRSFLKRETKTPGSLASHSPTTARTAYSSRKTQANSGTHLKEYPSWGSMQANAHSLEQARQDRFR